MPRAMAPIQHTRPASFVVGVDIGEEGEELLARGHDTTAELDRGDRALVDARGDRARIDPERRGGFFPSDDQAQTSGSG